MWCFFFSLNTLKGRANSFFCFFVQTRPMFYALERALIQGWSLIKFSTLQQVASCFCNETIITKREDVLKQNFNCSFSFCKILRKLGLRKSLFVVLSRQHSTQLSLRSILFLYIEIITFFWRSEAGERLFEAGCLLEVGRLIE